jgi:UDPglucose--hexose-1-phosphate uridylyltransferase
MEKLAEALVNGADFRSDEVLSKHADWADELCKKYTFSAENVDSILKDEIGKIFAKVLEHAGVYKRDEKGAAAFGRFVAYVNAR